MATIPPCPGCGSPPATDEVDDLCPKCGAYRFLCGRTTHIPLVADAPPIVQQLTNPRWERIPPSQVKHPITATEPQPAPRSRPSKKAKGAGRKRTRKREPRTVTLLLALLDDRRNMNLNLTELAEKLEVSVSAVSRAFHHKTWGPILKQRYADQGVPPPKIRHI